MWVFSVWSCRPPGATGISSALGRAGLPRRLLLAVEVPQGSPTYEARGEADPRLPAEGHLEAVAAVGRAPVGVHVRLVRCQKEAAVKEEKTPNSGAIHDGVELREGRRPIPGSGESGQPGWLGAGCCREHGREREELLSLPAQLDDGDERVGRAKARAENGERELDAEGGGEIHE